MPRSLSTLFVLVGLAVVAGYAAGCSAPASSASARVTLPEILDNAYERRADGTLALLDRLGEPQRVESVPVENRHVEGQTDTLRTLH